LDTQVAAAQARVRASAASLVLALRERLPETHEACSSLRALTYLDWRSGDRWPEGRHWPDH